MTDDWRGAAAEAVLDRLGQFDDAADADRVPGLLPPGA
jgi:hypothetical protein